MSGFFLPEFEISEAEKTELNVIFGPDNNAILDVQHVCKMFLVYRERDCTRSRKKDINDKLINLHHHFSKIALILDDNAVREELSLLVQNTADMPFLHKHGIGLRNLQTDIYSLKNATQGVKKLAGGRPAEPAGWYLAGGLYDICTKYDIPVTNVTANGVPAGVLHKILCILRPCLKIGRGEYDGIFTKAVEQKKQQTA